jgi:hypothetical protein
MATRWVRGAAAVLFATATLMCGCGDSGSATPVLLAGDWSGSLSIDYSGGGSDGGALGLTLDQAESFVSGIATWSLADGTLSISGPIDGASFTLYLEFRCDGKPELAGLTGAFDGTTLTFSGGSGLACPDGKAARAVSGASGSATRSSDAAPL